MSKYLLLVLLNLPFVGFGLLKSIILYKEKSLSTLSFLIRAGFWLTIAFGLLFAKNIYDLLVLHRLTDSPPLSLADVILVTGVSFCIFLTIRLYAKLENTERRLTKLQEKLSIMLSEKK